MDQPGPGVVELPFGNGNRALRTNVRLDEDLEDVAARLGLGARSQPVLVVCGGADKQKNGVSTPEGTALGRAISQAAEASGAIVVDGGTESGVMNIVGKARWADRTAMPTLVGVAPRGKVTEPGERKAQNRTALEPHHTHFVLANGDEFGSETDLLFSLAAELSRGDNVVVVLAGGGPNARREADEAVRRRWPLIAVEGFGGLADQVAVGDERAGKVRKYERLGVVRSSERRQLVDRLIWELATESVLKHAWRLYAAFDARANRLQLGFRLLQIAIIGLGIVVTALAVVHTAVSGGWKDAMHWATIVLPSVIAFLVAIEGRRAFGKRWIWLRAAAEAVLSETFRYRTLTRPYRRRADRETVLRQRLEVVNDQLSKTEAATAPLSRSTHPGPPGMVVNDDLRDLTPMGYLQRRVDDQLAYYHRTVRKKNLRRNVLQLVTLAAGATGTILAAAELEPWVAITAAVSAGAAAYLAARQHEQDVVVYNAAAGELESARLAWLGARRKDKDALETLVTRTEEILTEEVGAWARRMARVLDEQERQRHEPKT